MGVWEKLQTRITGRGMEGRVNHGSFRRRESQGFYYFSILAFSSLVSTGRVLQCSREGLRLFFSLVGAPSFA